MKNTTFNYIKKGNPSDEVFFTETLPYIGRFKLLDKHDAWHHTKAYTYHSVFSNGDKVVDLGVITHTHRFKNEHDDMLIVDVDEFDNDAMYNHYVPDVNAVFKLKLPDRKTIELKPNPDRASWKFGHAGLAELFHNVIKYSYSSIIPIYTYLKSVFKKVEIDVHETNSSPTAKVMFTVYGENRKKVLDIKVWKNYIGFYFADPAKTDLKYRTGLMNKSIVKKIKEVIEEQLA